LDLDDKNVAFIFCANGKTRSGILLACLLRFCLKTETSMDGFKNFCEVRCNGPVADIISKVPPSVQQFFRHFDDAVHLGRYPNPFPLILDKVRIQVRLRERARDSVFIVAEVEPLLLLLLFACRHKAFMVDLTNLVH